MATGIETAGLVLATLPLAVEIAKAYSNGARTISALSRNSRHDTALSDVYLKFYWNITEIDQHIEYIWHEAMGVMEQRPTAIELDQWQSRPEITEKLERFFQSDRAYRQYSVIANEIVALLVQLLAHGGAKISKADLNEKKMFEKLREFAIHRKSQKTSSTFLERFRLFKQRARRDECIQGLSMCSEQLRRLISTSRRPYSENLRLSKLSSTTLLNPVLLKLKTSSNRFRLLIVELYNGFSRCWKCDCCDIRDGRFCLNIHKPGRISAGADVELDFLASWPSIWKEGTVGIKAISVQPIIQGTKVEKMCEEFSTCVGGLRPLLLMEEFMGHCTLCRVPPIAEPGRILNSKPPVSLLELLERSKITPSGKRELAIISAYSLLLLHDTPWLHSGWNRTKLSFFYTPQQEPDFVRPFISTRFEGVAPAPVSLPFHRNSLILDLGILLIEILIETHIENWRTNRDKAEIVNCPAVAPTINLVVAHRLVDRMDPSPSKLAIEACLSLDWAPQRTAISLYDPQIQEGIFNNVILPLERELAMVE